MKILLLLALISLTGCVSVTATIQQASPEGKQTIKADTDMTPTTTTKASLGVGVGQAPQVTSGSVK